MRKIFFALTLFSISQAVSFAQEIIPFKRVQASSSAKNIKITSYNGASTSAEVIVPLHIADSTVTQISGLLGTSNNWPSVEKIFIPKGVKITAQLLKDQHSLSTVAFDCNSIVDYSFAPFYFYDIKSSIAFFAFGTNKQLTADDVTRSGSSKKCREAGTIHVDFRLGEPIDIQTILMAKTSTDVFNFGDDRFKNLIWAIQEKLKSEDNETRTINDIKSIEIPGSNFNITFSSSFNPATLLNIGATVVTSNCTYTNSVSEGETITITDMLNYSLPVSEQTAEINYSRAITDGWNSVCLPFDITEEDFPTGTKIYKLGGAVDGGIKLTRQTEVAAGTPCFIYSEAESWDLTFNNCTLDPNTKPGTITADDWQMIGSFTEYVIGTGKYKLTADGQYLGPTLQDKALVYPFRCYLENLSSTAPSRVPVFIDDEATITLHPDDAAPVNVRYYDLFGRPAAPNDGIQLRKGNVLITH